MSMPFRLRHCNCLEKSTVHLWNAGHLRPAKRSGWAKILQPVGQTNSTSFWSIVTFKNLSHCYIPGSALPRLSISLDPFGFIPLLSAPASKWQFFRTCSVQVAKSTDAPGISLALRAFAGRCKTFWALSLLCCFEGLSDSALCALDTTDEWFDRSALSFVFFIQDVFVDSQCFQGTPSSIPWIIGGGASGGWSLDFGAGKRAFGNKVSPWPVPSTSSECGHENGKSKGLRFFTENCCKACLGISL